ncbi:MAG: patatin-like phospholipase family protein [Bacteroidota bacterium]|nr:patatin-like phospholipase family protein [Kiloniellaceae bacterium]
MAAKTEVRRVNLALQGGGSHGAFTWGVLDRLLADERIEIEAISGTSAGAMNAVALAEGMMSGGPQEARACLRRFWQGVSEAGRGSLLRRTPLDVFMGNWNLDTSPVYLLLDLLGRVASPYEFNPLNLNPLRTLIDELVDFERVRACHRMKIFVSATNVETGRVQVFERHELTADMVMASACLPLLFQAVEIDGVPYWDGGYMGNPALFPFFDASESDDVIVVQINPVFRQGAPRSAREIVNRMNEITFNSSLLREYRAIDFVSRLIDEGKLDRAAYKQMHIHRISAEEEINPLGASSKMNAEWAFLEYLFEVGRRAADAWLADNFRHLGRRSTLDLRGLYQGPESELTDPERVASE